MSFLADAFPITTAAFTRLRRSIHLIQAQHHIAEAARHLEDDSLIHDTVESRWHLAMAGSTPVDPPSPSLVAGERRK